MKSIVLLAAEVAVMSSLAGEAWFDAGIKDYTSWPTDGSSRAVAGAGTWTGTDAATLVGEKGAKTLQLSTGPLGFTASSPLEISADAVRMTSRVTFSQLPDAKDLPAPEAGRRTGLTAAAEGYYGLVLDTVGGTNAWTRLAGATPSEGAAVTVGIEVKSVSGADKVRYLVNGAALTSATVDWLPIVTLGADSPAGEIAYIGEGVIASLSGSSDATVTPPGGGDVVVDGLVINEVMASNGGSYKTSGGEALDWVELYNGGDEDIDLAGWFMGDDPKDPRAQWPAIQNPCVVPANGYAIVWCDKTAAFAANEAFVRIGLSASGESVFIATPNGEIVSRIDFPEQTKGVSYGPAADGSGNTYFQTPTPGAANDGNGKGGMTPEVVFSVPHGYKTEAFPLALSCPKVPTAAIYYTTDGSSPTVNSIRYTEPFMITNTTCIRAAVPDANAFMQRDTSATYIFLDEVLAQDRATGFVPDGFPADKAVNGQHMRYGLNQEIVTGEDREHVLRGFTNTIATLSIVIDPENLFNATTGIYVNASQDGREWERMMMLEQIDPVNGEKNEFSVPGGIRIRGRASRGEGYAKHSLRFFFRSEYGMNELKFPLFGDEGADSFKKVDLRCSQNYSWANQHSGTDTFIHECFSRDSQRDMGEHYTRSRYYNLFINGQYWGLYQTQERGDEDFAASYNGGDADNYDIHKMYDYEDDSWNALRKIAVEEGFDAGHEANYQRVLGLNADGTRNPAYPVYLNPTNLMVYMISAHYACDGDCPASAAGAMPNNLYMLRNMVDGESKQDGFFFLRHDCELSLGIFKEWSSFTNNPTGYGVTGEHPVTPVYFDATSGYETRGNYTGIAEFNPADLHFRLCKNPEYRRAFADVFYKHCLKTGGAMTAPKARARFESRMAEINDAIACESARWATSLEWWNENKQDRNGWLKACNICLDFIDKRMPYMKSQYQARGWYPSIDAPEADIAEGRVEPGVTVTFAAEGADAIYLTLDGSDPMTAEPSASGAIVISEGNSRVVVKARAKKGDEWSALNEMTYSTGNSDADIRDNGHVYYYQGDYKGVQEIAMPTDGTNEVEVILDGANVPGGFVIPAGLELKLALSNDTENTVGFITGPEATLKVNGDGKVTLEGPDTLVSVSNLVVKGGNFKVKTTGVKVDKTPVVNVLGYVKQSGGKINVNLEDAGEKQVYGIYLANKNPKTKDPDGNDYVYGEFSDGTFKATVGGVKSAAFYGNKGSADVTFKDTIACEVDLVGSEARFLNVAGKLRFKGGTYAVTESDPSLAPDAKVFKGGREITISGGAFDVTVTGAGSEVFSTSINNDGDPSTITVSGGTFEIVSDGDAFTAENTIDISDGLFYVESLSNNAFDGKTGVTVSGGTILAYATAEGRAAFHVEMLDGAQTPLTLKILGGTVFATGGNASDWPVIENAVAVYANDDLSASDWSGKYVSVVGEVNGIARTTTAKLPALQGETCAILATCPNMSAGAAPEKSDSAPTEGDQEFHDLYIVGATESPQQALRFYEIYGSTAGDGDTGEYIVLTNTSAKTVSLNGLRITSSKFSNGVAETPKLDVTITNGLTVAANGTVRLNQSDVLGKGKWDKITNGSILIKLVDETNEQIQEASLTFDDYPTADGKGDAVRAQNFNDTLSEKTDWTAVAHSEPEEPAEDEDFTLAFTSISVDGEEVTFTVTLYVEGVPTEKTVSGKVELLHWTDLTSDPETITLESKTFPLTCRQPASSAAGFWQAVVK